MKKFLTTPIGSIVKVFVSVALGMLYTQYQDGTLCTELMCFKSIGIASLFACFPMLINFFNPDYDGYGVKKDTKELE